MKLIETQLFKPHKLSLTEEKSQKGLPVVEGILATAEVKNGNGRYYKRSLWEREMAKYNIFIEENRAMGELDHPDSSVVNLQNVSHNIIKAWWDGNSIVGQIEILPTPSGNILKSLLDHNITVGVSSRGMGSLKETEGLLEVQDDFELLCWDFVSTPSNPGSWMNPVGTLNEGMDASSHYNPYKKTNSIITDILCSQGNCPIF